MKAKILIILISLYSCTFGMSESNKKQSEIKSNLCSLSVLPREILSLIASHFVSFEQDAQFLERNKNIDQGSDKKKLILASSHFYLKKILGKLWFFYKLRDGSTGFRNLPKDRNTQTKQEILFSFCPDFSKIIFLENLNEMPSKIIVQDLKTNENKEIEKEKIGLATGKIHALAISSEVNQLATITCDQFDNMFSILLKISNLKTQRVTNFHFFRNEKPRSCHFNKQGTKILVNFENEQVVRLLSSEKIHYLKTVHPLLKYFQDHGVCKKLIFKNQ